MKLYALVALFAFPYSCFANTFYIHEIPDFTQTLVRGKGTGNGQQYCGPVAVSNSLVWLHKNKSDQMQMILKLASKDYMKTSLKNGTGTSGLLRGVAKLSTELFGGYKALEYEGWRKHPKQYSSGIRVPNIKRIKHSVSKRSATWLNVGWYKYHKDKKEYQRIGGHWVTLVGSKAHQLVLHDPAPRAGKTFSNEFVSYKKLKRGTLVGNKKGLPFSAKGLLSLEAGMHIKKAADYAIVDGVVYLEL